MHHHPQYNLLKYISAFTGTGGILWLIAIGEGHALLFSPEFGTVLASALTSAGLAVSAGMWVMNLVIDRKLAQFEKEFISPNYMTQNQCGTIHAMQDDRYGWIKEQLEALREGQLVTQGKIDELWERQTAEVSVVKTRRKRK